MITKEKVHELIDNIPESEHSYEALKRISEIAKKAGKETRCAPKRRKLEAHLSDMRDEMITVMIRNRAAR